MKPSDISIETRHARDRRIARGLAQLADGVNPDWRMWAGARTGQADDAETALLARALGVAATIRDADHRRATYDDFADHLIWNGLWRRESTDRHAEPIKRLARNVWRDASRIMNEIEAAVDVESKAEVRS